MAGGNAHDRRKFERAVSRETERRHSRDEAFALVSVIVTVAIAIPAYADVLPMEFTVAVDILGLVMLGIAARYWRRTVAWNSMAKSLCILAAFIFYLIILWFPLKKEYMREMALNLSFKDAPEFTWVRRQLITYRMAKMRNYLVDLHVPVPDAIPPLVSVIIVVQEDLSLVLRFIAIVY